jgi:hypothetical protein
MGLLLPAGDFQFESADAKLDLFNGVKVPPKFHHPATQGILLSFQLGAEALELAISGGIVERWGGGRADEAASRCGHGQPSTIRS